MAKSLLALSFLAAVSTTAALADGTAPAAPAPACDYFDAQLIGVFCGHTAFIAPYGGDGVDTITRTTTTSPSPGLGWPPVFIPAGSLIPRGPFGFRGVTTVERWNYNNAYEGVGVAISPWQGVQFHISGEALQFDNSFSSQTPGLFGGFSPIASRDSGGIPGWQSIGAAVTLWDSHFDSPFGHVHYVLSAIGGLEMAPAGGPYRAIDLQQIGWQSGAELPLGGSGYSLAYFATNLLQRFDNPGLYDFKNSTRVLIANEAWGVAVGPLLDSESVLWHAPGSYTGWSAFAIGGEALIQPFRRTSIPVLRDVTVELSATHSLGQADLVPNFAGSASGYAYEASARFNFAF